MKTFYVFGLILLVFACDPINSDEGVHPSQQSDTGGDDEDPIIQGSSTGGDDEDPIIQQSDTGGDDEDPIIQGVIIFPNDSCATDSLISLLDHKSGQVLDFTLSNSFGKFNFQLPRRRSLVLRVVCADGSFRNTEPFGLDTLPAILKVG